MPQKIEMIAALRARLVPELRQRGFKGSLPHFRRARSGAIDLLTVQFDRHGGGFIVEIAKCEPEGVTTYWGAKIPPNKVTAHDLHPNERHRLGALGPNQDGRWFRFDDGVSTEAVSSELIRMLAEADSWWIAG